MTEPTARGGRGRPHLPNDERRSRTLRFRCTGDDRKSYQAAADRAGVSLSEWIRIILASACDEDGEPVSPSA